MTARTALIDSDGRCALAHDHFHPTGTRMSDYAVHPSQNEPDQPRTVGDAVIEAENHLALTDMDVELQRGHILGRKLLAYREWEYAAVLGQIRERRS